MSAPRGGFALPFVLLVLAMVGLVAWAGWAGGWVDVRAGRAAIRAVGRSFRAEQEVVDALANVPPARVAVLPNGSSMVAPGGVVVVRRLNDRVFLYDILGRVGAPGEVAMLARLEPPSLGPWVAFVSGGPVRLRPGAVVLGPATPGGRCSAADSAGAYPPLPTLQGVAARAPAFLGVRATATLAPGSVLTPGPTVSSRACRTADPANWGDPTGSVPLCASYHAIVVVPGGVTVVGGVGQGVLIVGGDLRVSGRFRFDGLVFVGGRVVIGGAGAVIRGSIQVLDTRGIGSDLGGGTRIVYSACTLRNAALAAGTMGPIPHRAWLGPQ